jgi:hypothetical protein
VIYLGTVSTREFEPGDVVQAFLAFALREGENSDWSGGYIHRDGKVPLPDTLSSIRKHRKILVLEPGKHKARLAIPYNDGPHPPVYAYSNPVEIEIPAGAESGGASEKLRLPGNERDNPLGLNNEILIRLFNTGKTLRAAARESIAYHVKYSKIPKNAEVLFADYQQFQKAMIVDPFATGDGVLRLTQRMDDPDERWLQVWSVGPDGDWDGGKQIDSSDASLDGDLGAEVRIDKWSFNWLAGETMAIHLDGKRLSHYLAAQAPKHPGPIIPLATRS